MLERIYQDNKQLYNEYIILIKNGNFYLCFNKDAIVMNEIFKYQIKDSKNYIKIGFPIIALSKVIDKLDKLSVNYLVIENNEIIDKKKNQTNNYIKYEKNQYIILNNRINNIYNILKNNISNKNVENIIKEIENIICKINL